MAMYIEDLNTDLEDQSECGLGMIMVVDGKGSHYAVQDGWTVGTVDIHLAKFDENNNKIADDEVDSVELAKAQELFNQYVKDNYIVSDEFFFSANDVDNHITRK